MFIYIYLYISIGTMKVLQTALRFALVCFELFCEVQNISLNKRLNSTIHCIISYHIVFCNLNHGHGKCLDKLELADN